MGASQSVDPLVATVRDVSVAIPYRSVPLLAADQGVREQLPNVLSGHQLELGFKQWRHLLAIDGIDEGRHQGAPEALRELGHRSDVVLVAGDRLSDGGVGQLSAVPEVILAAGGMATTLGTIFLSGMAGLYCLIAISACMSLMFPTIYGIALQGLGEDAKFGAAGLIMAILGGSVMPPMQGAIIDMGTVDMGFMTLASVNASFVLPLICFVAIAIYGFRAYRTHARATA